MGSYSSAAIDQSTGHYYGGGLSHTRTESTSDAWDPDGSGIVSASIPLSGPSSIGTAYDAAHNLLYAVTWDTAGYDIINFIAPTNDGTNDVFWAGEKLDDCHIELRDVSGAVVWSDTFDMSPGVGVERIASVKVDTNGDLLVSGYFENGGAGGGAAAYDTFVRKYEKTAHNTYAVQWTSTSKGPDGARDLLYDSAFDPTDKTLYLLSDSYGQVDTTTGFLYAENSDLLVRKMIPGDFNSDGIVDFVNDVQTVGAATKSGPLGNDTYDFNGDGDSTFPEDVTYLITTLMDRNLGDIHQDSGVSDVDNADIGKVIGNIGSGTLYVDGDIDFDGTVDAADVASVSGAFTGARAPAGGPALATGTTLTYIADVGTVFLTADGAAGGIITSFQLENTEGTFVEASYTGLTGGSFGGTYAQATANVLADSDTTVAGISGEISLGSVFPTGMDQAGLEAYLTTAVYTGQAGSGQMEFALVALPTLPTAYEAWAAGFPSLSDMFANIDFEGDGISTGLEYVLGGDPTANDAALIAPTSEYSGSGLVFTFRRADLANDDPDANFDVRYSTDLMTWTLAEDGMASVSIVENNNFYGSSPGIDQVVVTLPSSLEVDGKLFARLGVSGLPESLLNEDFEAGDGGFTMLNNGTGDTWEYGTPNSDGGFGGGAVTGGNGGSMKCWGTDIGNTGVYAPGTDTSLISPVIDLSKVAGATLSFAEALDIFAGDLLTVNIIDDDISSGPVTIGTPIYTADDAGANLDANWNPVTGLDLAAGVGQKVRIEWRFTGANDGAVTYIGAYIDDVVVTTP